MIQIWWHLLRNAQLLLSTHHFIRQDVYAFTPYDQLWINLEWLSEIPYYIGFHFFGERGLFLLMLVAVELFVGGMLLRCYRRSGRCQLGLPGHLDRRAIGSNQHRATDHSLRLALFSRRVASSRSIFTRPQFYLAASITLCPMDQPGVAL